MPEAFHARRLRDRLDELEALCARFFGTALRIEIEDFEERGTSQSDTTSQTRELARQRRQAALSHPAVNVALRELEAEIVDILPIEERR